MCSVLIYGLSGFARLLKAIEFAAFFQRAFLSNHALLTGEPTGENHETKRT
jgi:hypothetical protein